LCYTLSELRLQLEQGSSEGPFFWSEDIPVERTLFIIKPDAVGRSLIGSILSCVEETGLKVRGLRMTRLSETEVGDFYHVHRGKPFYENLVSYMISGDCVVVVVEGENAIARLRRICGVTDPSVAAEGTIRSAFGINLTMNSVHASDSPASAAEEVRFFFPDLA
jgi:nucleoside-diphosphate kinase